MGGATPSWPAGFTRLCLRRYPTSPAPKTSRSSPSRIGSRTTCRDPGDRPEATFVAVAGDEVIGFAKFSLTSAQPATAHHDLTGVKRSWRGRGVARALKATQIGGPRRTGTRS